MDDHGCLDKAPDIFERYLILFRRQIQLFQIGSHDDGFVLTLPPQTFKIIFKFDRSERRKTKTWHTSVSAEALRSQLDTRRNVTCIARIKRVDRVEAL
ncbi:hypothetical protein D9M68_928690 [compost metagenome]